MITRFIIILTLILFPLSAFGVDSLKIYRKQADGAFNRSDYKNAVENYRHILRLDPGNFKALKSLGMSFAIVGDRIQALAYYNKAYRIDSLDASLNNNMGALFSSMNDPEKAIEYFEKAVLIDSTKTEHQSAPC